MKQINLLDYVLKDQKISQSLFLEEKKISRKRLLLKMFLSTSFDFSLCFYIYNFLYISMNSQLTPHYKNYFLKISDHHFHLSEMMFIFGGVLAVYVFSLFFFNNGQTLGLKLFGLRFNIKYKKFFSYLSNSSMYFLVCLSGGFLNFFETFQKKIIPHDDLYIKLFNAREDNSYKLLDHISSDNLIVKAQTTDIKNVA